MRNLHKIEHDSSKNLRGKTNFMQLKSSEYDPQYLKMDDSDSSKKYPTPLGIASRLGSEVSHLNDVEKTFDAIYKAHD